MISPHTPPGALIVALYDCPPSDGQPPLVKGQVYTLAQIVRGQRVDGSEGFGVITVEHGEGHCYVRRPWYAPWRWRDKVVTFKLMAFRPINLAGLEKLQTQRAPVA